MKYCKETVSGQSQTKAQIAMKSAAQDHQQSSHKNGKENSRQNTVEQLVATIQGGQNNKPHANAGNEQKVLENTPVVLDGTKSSDSNSDKLSYIWTQVIGQEVKLIHATKAVSSFKSPTILAVTKNTDTATVEFKLTITDLLNGKQDTDVVKILVMKKQPRDNSLYPINNKKPIYLITYLV